MNKKWKGMIIFIGVLILIIFYFIPEKKNIEKTDYKNNIFNNNITSYNEIKDDFSNISELHWSHMPITYSFVDENKCTNWTKDHMILAFYDIGNETDWKVSFIENSENPDILIDCKSSNYDSSGEGILGDAICKTDKSNEKLIIHAKINIYSIKSCGTGYPVEGVHEILHTFGFIHNPNSKSIMQEIVTATSGECQIIKIDKEYISCLKYIYSNGKIYANCSKINTVTSSEYMKSPCDNPCENGWYLSEEMDSCCPEPNMKIVNGYCSY